jgi:hypothetical protein
MILDNKYIKGFIIDNPITNTNYVISISIFYLFSILITNYILLSNEIIIEQELSKSKAKALKLMTESEAEELIENTRDVLNSDAYKIFVSFKVLLERILTSIVFLAILFFLEYLFRKIKLVMFFKLVLPAFIIIVFRDWIYLLISVFMTNELFVLIIPNIFFKNDLLSYTLKKLDFLTIIFLTFISFRISKYFNVKHFESSSLILIVYFIIVLISYISGYNGVIF